MQTLPILVRPEQSINPLCQGLSIISEREGEAPAEPCLNVPDGSAGASPSQGKLSTNAKKPFDGLRVSGKSPFESIPPPLRLSSSKPRLGKNGQTQGHELREVVASGGGIRSHKGPYSVHPEEALLQGRLEGFFVCLSTVSRGGTGLRRLSTVAISAGLALLLLLAAPLARTAAGEETTNADCLDCHDDEEFTSADKRSLHVSTAGFAASVHGELECTNCHADIEEIPHEDDLAKVDLDTCEGCHDEAVVAYRTSRHAAAAERPAAASCADCHGDVHGARSHQDPASSAHWSHLAATCAKCHAESATSGARLPIMRPVESYLKSVHSTRVAAGTHAAVCSDCHGSHAILPASDPSSTIWPSRVPDTCGTCHGDIAAEFRDSVHGAALARGLRDAPSCTDCHGEHDILPSSDPAAPVFTRNVAAMTCGRCHGDLRLTRKYGLSADQVEAYQDSFHGLALRAGQVNVANCASCHGVHDILPSSDPRSRINAAHLPSTCGKCHPGAGSSFPIGEVHVLAKGSPHRVEYWIRYVYLWGIVLVIGAMALHVAIDFAVKVRHWPPPPPAAAAPTRERMSRPLRWQHGLVMLSFPVLVLTGFALTYPESWWAAPLLRWEARLGLRGTVHRGAALIILAALLWHLGQFVTSPTLRGRLRGLRWSRNDLRYFIARWAWYLGLRPTLPPSGSFSYIEKAEYWAFLWGMLIMTVSGLVLWFSDLTLRYLPKWFTDVATAVHFYEAVLASLAVAVWHLYWVVFDPDVYPMDRSWWSGHPPASRVHEREGDAADDEDSPDSGGTEPAA